MNWITSNQSYGSHYKKQIEEEKKNPNPKRQDNKIIYMKKHIIYLIEMTILTKETKT